MRMQFTSRATDTKKTMKAYPRLDPTCASLVLMFLCASPLLGSAGPATYTGQNTCTDVKPKMCPYYETCCRLSEYCSDRSRACEPCFPPKMSSQQRLTTCQTLGVKNVTWLSHTTCTLACMDIFTSEELYSTENSTSGKTNSANSFDKTEELELCERRQHIWIVILAMLVFAFIVHMLCCFALKRESLQKKLSIVSIHGRETAGNCLQSIHCTLPKKHAIPIHVVGEENTKKSSHSCLKSTNDTGLDAVTGGHDDVDEPCNATQKLLSKVDKDSMDDGGAEDQAAAAQLSPNLNTRTRERLPVPQDLVDEGDEPKYVHQK